MKRHFVGIVTLLSFIPNIADAKGLTIKQDKKLIPRIVTPGSTGQGSNGVARPTLRTVSTCTEVSGPSAFLTLTGRYVCENGALGFRGCYGVCPPPAPGSPPPPRPDVRAMIDSAVGNVPDPEPVTSPPLRDDDDVSVVGVPFFFSVPAEQWTTISPTATQGPYYLTINATPAMLTFDPGTTGPRARCDNPGRSVRTQAQARAAKSLGCYHVYQDAPRNGATYPASLAITWNLSVTTNLAPSDYVNLVPATMTTTSAFDVPVIELQPVLVSPSG